MYVATNESDGITHITLEGELNLETARAVTEAWDDRSTQSVVIDLRRLSFIDSQGVRALLQLHYDSQREGVRLAMVRGSGQIERVFELTRVGELLPLVDSPDRLGPG